MAAWLLARSEWRRRWGALGMLAVLIAVTGGVTIAAAVGARRADSAFARFVDQTGDPEVIADAIDVREAWDPALFASGAAVFAAAAASPGVVRGQRLVAFAVAAGESPDAFSFALLDEAGAPDQPFLVDGRVFDPDDPYEVMVNEAGAEIFDVGPGDPIRLRSISADRVDEYLGNDGAFLDFDGPEIVATVTGVERNAFDIAQQDDPFVLLTPAFARRFGTEIVSCACVNLFDAEAGRVDEVLDEVTRLYQPLGFNVGLEEDGNLAEHVANGIDVEVTAMWLLALAAGVAGFIVVAQAMARQLAEPAVERDIGGALGATPGQLTAAGVLTVAPAVIAGAAAAVVIAIALSPLTPRGLAKRAEVDPGVWIDGVAIGLGAVGVLVIGGGLLWGVARWTARRRTAPPPRFVGLPPGLGPSGLLGVSFALRPGRRGRAAAGAAVVATAMGVAGVLAVWSFDAGRQRLVEDGRLFGADADLAWRGPDEDVAEVAAAAGREPGVEAVGLRLRVGGDEELTLSGPRGSTTTLAGALDAARGWPGPTIVRGRGANGTDEVALGRRHLEVLGVDIGDAVTVAGSGGAVDMTVVGEVVAWETDEIDEGFEVTPVGLQTIAEVACSDRQEACAPDLDYVVVRTIAGDAGDGARASLQLAGFAPVPLPSEIDNIDQAGSLPWVLGIFLAVMGVAALLHALVSVLRQRRRDVVIGRALGLSAAGARATTRWSAATIAVIGVGVGLPLGMILGRLIWAHTANRLGAVVEHALPWWAPPVVAVSAIAVSVALAEAPARRAANHRPAEVLRTE